MLTLYHDGQQLPIQNTEYYVRELASGLDEVIFDISIYDPIYAILQEEEQITDRGGQRYLVKQIDAGADSAKVVCQLDLDAWKSAMHVEYSNGSATAYETINAVKPSGWTVLDLSHVNIRRTITGDYTPLEICAACVKTYRVYIRWDNLQKVCMILPEHKRTGGLKGTARKPSPIRLIAHRRPLRNSFSLTPSSDGVWGFLLSD